MEPTLDADGKIDYSFSGMIEALRANGVPWSQIIRGFAAALEDHGMGEIAQLIFDVADVQRDSEP